MKTINLIKRMFKENFSLTKITAVFTALCFVTSVIGSQSAYAAIPVPNTVPVNISSADMPKELIPFNLGRITDAYYTNSDDIVINIQDLHSHEQTQKNISSILSVLDSKFGISDIYIEGASGILNTQWLSNISDSVKKQQVVNNLLSSGKLTGGEYFAIQSEKDITLKGLEDKALYSQNFERLNNIFNKQTEIKNYISILNNIFNEKSQIYYSNENKKTNRIISNYKNGKIKTKKYIELLIDNAKKADINLSKYPAIISFAQIVSKQNDFDSKKLSGEIQTILNELKETLNFNEYKSLSEKASKKESEVEFYFELLQKAKEHNILSRKSYRNTNAFLEYLLLNKNFNTIELANEEALLIREINTKFSETEQEKEIFFLKDFLNGLSHYLTNKMTAKEYDKFIENIDTFKLLWAKYIDIDRITDISEYFNLVEDFYKNNIERNRVFIKNLFGKTPADKENIFRIKNSRINHEQKVIEKLSQGKKIHIIITGGFHTDGFDKLLRDENINYIVITPNITESAAHSDELFRNFFNEQYDITNNTFANRPMGEVVNLLNKGEIKDVRPDGNDVIIEYISGEIVRLNQLPQQPVNENILTEEQIEKVSDAFIKIQQLQQIVREQERAGADLNTNTDIIMKLADLEEAVNGLDGYENIQELKDAFTRYIDELRINNPEIPSDTGKLVLPVTKKITDMILFLPSLVFKFFNKPSVRNRFYSINAAIFENTFLFPLILFKPEKFVIMHYGRRAQQQIRRTLNKLDRLYEIKDAIDRLEAVSEEGQTRTEEYQEQLTNLLSQLRSINGKVKILNINDLMEEINKNEIFLENIGYTQRLNETRNIKTSGFIMLGLAIFLLMTGIVGGIETNNIGSFSEGITYFRDNIRYVLYYFAAFFGLGYYGSHAAYNLSIDSEISKAKSALRKDIEELVEIFPNDISYENIDDLNESKTPLAPIFVDILDSFNIDDSFDETYEKTTSKTEEYLTVLEVLKGHSKRGGDTDKKALKHNIDIILDYFVGMPVKVNKNEQRVSVLDIMDDIDYVLANPNLTEKEKEILTSFKNNFSDLKRPRFKLNIPEARNQEEKTTILQAATGWAKSVYTNAVDYLQRATYAFLFKDHTEYTIVANVNDSERRLQAESLAASGIKVNLVLVGKNNLIKELPERIAYNGRYLAYGLIDDDVKNLKIYGYDDIDDVAKFSQQAYLSAILDYINNSSKNTVKILDLSADLNDINVTDIESEFENSFTATGVGKNPFQLFLNAIKAKKAFTDKIKISKKSVADMYIKPSLVASNISAEQISSFGITDITKLIEQGITTLIVSIDDNFSQAEINKLLQTAHDNGLKVIINYKIVINEEHDGNMVERINAFNKMISSFDIDGVQIDLSENGEYANDMLALNSISSFTKAVNERKVGSYLAVKMPKTIHPTEYAEYFKLNGTKAVFDHSAPYAFSGLSLFEDGNVIINISADENGEVSPAQLTGIFENNNVSMISVDQGILEQITSSEFTFNGMTLTKFITSIFETTPAGQEMRGVNKGRSFVKNGTVVLSDNILTKLCNMYIANDFNIAEINDMLATNFKENISKYELKGFVAGVIQTEELNRLDAADITFDKTEYANLLMQSLLEYRLVKGESFANGDTSKDVKEVLITEKFNANVQPEITKVVNILNGADGNIDTIITILSLLKDNSTLTNEERAAVLEGLLLLLFSDAIKPEADISSILGENMDIKKMHAILSAA